MSGTDDPTHVYWDLENRKGLWARGEAMSKTPTARELCRVGYEEEQNGKLAQLNKLVAGSILAARVEAVLALLEKYRTIPADLIERVLDGGKP